ncbi:hypothetical protein JTE90_014410 [Oedothorax gibbosus]|uniref:Ig-like domain-containing protein n=1 Tax=Oedothorax gibbosus TaxID=931172 RepID=A0AAV6UGG2_9ARAC|nr:hypothetical protein JTE90_014410 [Oedothorax gibbosus]
MIQDSTAQLGFYRRSVFVLYRRKDYRIFPLILLSTYHAKQLNLAANTNPKMRFIGAALLLSLAFLSTGAAHLTLSISPLGKDVILEENADLNLTCRVITKDRSNIRYELSWKLPTRTNSQPKSSVNADRITVYQRNDQLTVTIHSMQEEDTGIYVCKLQEDGIIWTKKIAVFVRSKKCNDPFFDCGGGLCIYKHFVCDGYIDCPSGYDEEYKYCGQDACRDKILCDGRCITKDLCCDPLIQHNCTANYLMPCCQNIMPQREVINAPPCSPAEECHYGHFIGVGNSIMYIVASCAGVVMIVSTIIMFLACRICSKHSGEMQRWARAQPSGLHRQYMQGVSTVRDSDSTDNVDFMFEDINSDQCRSGTDTPDDFVLCNFVPGFGYEIADCGPKPPPYTENVIGIPPPPYQSRIDLTEPNKDEDGNNESVATPGGNSNQ